MDPLWALFVLDLLGFGGLLFWINRQIVALKGTVDAQAETLRTLQGLNQTALEVVKGVDPERWAAEVRIHKDLADQKAQALIDEARREFDQEKKSTLEKQARVAQVFRDQYSAALQLAFGLIAYIPKHSRMAAIEERDVPKDLKELYLKLAEKSPDRSTPPLLQALFEISPNVGLSHFAPSVEDQETKAAEKQHMK
ncbi:MAG TPA: hypothetical protein VIG37_09670 [Methylomirabilota bacterium]|jgi:hypothetical protein